MLKKMELLYEGKAKKIYKTDHEDIVWVEYKDSATAFNGLKKEEFVGKGKLNNEITSFLFLELQRQGIDNHFIQRISDTEQLVKKVCIAPLEVVVRNKAAGSLAKRLGLEEGALLSKPLVEFYYKNDELGDPLITIDHIQELRLATLKDVEILKEKALQVNTVLSNFFSTIHVQLIDFKLEFGKDKQGNILLADEISPDTCRLWDSETNEKLDKDVFRLGLGNITDVYDKLLTRLGGK